MLKYLKRWYRKLMRGNEPTPFGDLVDFKKLNHRDIPDPDDFITNPTPEFKKQLKILSDKIDEDNLSDYESFVEQDLKDWSSYEIECKRFGDFLYVKITRLVRKGVTEIDSLSIPLKDTRIIHLRKGHRADMRGGSKLGIVYLDEHNNLITDVSSKRDNRSLWEDASDRTRMSIMPLNIRNYINPDRIVLKVLLPCESKDDVIVFVGTNISIWVPFGLGEEIELKILNTIKEGYDPPSHGIA